MTLLSVAPMEGLTTSVFRQVHAKTFGPADLYYLPFITPTTEPKFTDRQLREVDPRKNTGLNVIPQLLSNRAADFNWAAEALFALGYKEVNLNLGCPAGTVVAKHKGSGFLRVLDQLKIFLDGVFAVNHRIDISIKTRIGWANEEEFEDIANLYKQYPLANLIIHPRLKTDQYKGHPRSSVFDKFLNTFPFPVGYNGDLYTVEDMNRRLQVSPGLHSIMIGRGLIADPALFRKFKGGRPASKQELIDFSQNLYDGYAIAFESRKNAVMRMKEYWFFQLCLLTEDTKLSKKLFKSKTIEDYESSVKEIFEFCDVLEHPRFGWFKPL